MAGLHGAYPEPPPLPMIDNDGPPPMSALEFLAAQEQQQQQQEPLRFSPVESDAPVDGKSSVCGASLAHLLQTYAPNHDLPTQVVLPLLAFLRIASRPPQEGPPPSPPPAATSLQEDTSLLVSSLFGDQAENASPLPPLSFDDGAPIVLPSSIADAAMMDTADDDDDASGPQSPPRPVTIAASWDRMAAVEDVPEEEKRRRTLHVALQTFEARLQESIRGVHTVRAELRAFHTKGYLCLRSVVDLAGVDSVLHDIQTSPEDLGWEVIAPQFDGVAGPVGSVPREMASVELPNLVDVIVTAAKEHNIFIELGRVHRHRSTKVLRSSAGVVAQMPHIDGPHPEPLHECEVPPFVAIVAMHDNTPIIVYPGAILGQSWQEATRRELRLNAGDVLLMRSDLYHAGAAFTHSDIVDAPYNYRVFMYFATEDYPHYDPDIVYEVALDRDAAGSDASRRRSGKRRLSATAPSANSSSRASSNSPRLSPASLSASASSHASDDSQQTQTPAQRKAIWQRNRRALRNQHGNDAVLDTRSLGRDYAKAVSDIVAALQGADIAELRCCYQQLNSNGGLRDAILSLPEPPRDDAGTGTRVGDAKMQWQQTLCTLLSSNASSHYCKGLLVHVLWNHLEREYQSLSVPFDVVYKRLIDLVGPEARFGKMTAQRHYHYAMALDAYPALAALKVRFLTIATVWQGTMKVRQLHKQHEGASGLLGLPAPLNEVASFSEGMAAVMEGLPRPGFLATFET